MDRQRQSSSSINCRSGTVPVQSRNTRSMTAALSAG
jgi:hypothetical protein